jgi:hypothetical protein
VQPHGNFAFPVPAEDVHKLIEKLVRGTVYITEGRYIEAHETITVSILKREDEGEVLGLLESFGELHERGPGIRIRKATVPGFTDALFVFDVWDQFRFYGAVTPQLHAADNRPS